MKIAIEDTIIQTTIPKHTIENESKIPTKKIRKKGKDRTSSSKYRGD